MATHDKETSTSKSETSTTETQGNEYDYIDYQSLPADDSNCDVTAVDVEELIEDCPTCVPNPKAPVIDWTKRTDSEPFLNERKCTYSIVLRTKYEGTGGTGELQDRLDEYTEEGVIKLLAHYNKALDANTVAAMLSVAGATDHFVPPRPKLKMKVLIEIPANDFDKMPSAQEVPEDSTQSEEDAAADEQSIVYTATLEIEGLEEKFKQIEHGLSAYARFQVIYLKTQGGQVRFPGGQMVNLLQESRHFKKVYPAIVNFLRDKGFSLREGRGNNTLGKIPGGPKLANKVVIDFDDGYVVKKVTVLRHGTCEEKPTVFKGNKLYTLKNTYPFDRPTTMAFLPKIEEMTMDLRRREGMMPWTEFARTYVWPTPSIASGVDLTSAMAAFASAATGQATDKDMETLAKTAVTMSEADKISSQTPGSWKAAEDAYADYKERSGQDNYRGSALENRLEKWNDPDYTYEDTINDKTLDSKEQAAIACAIHEDGLKSVVGEAWDDFSEGFMDELFSIWDAVSYQFQNYLCMSPEERAKLLADLQSMRSQAMVAAFAEMMALMFGFVEMIQSFQESLDEIKDLKNLYSFAFDEIKLCGLFNLLMAFIECLAMGLDLEEMLQPLLAAALANMDVVPFEKLFVGLPPEVQAEVMAKVEADLGSHMMPWDAAKIQGKPDPAAETSFANKPSAGTVVSWGGPGTPLNAEKSAARQDPDNIKASDLAVARKLENAAKQIREGSVYYTDPDENGNSEKKYALTEAQAFEQAVMTNAAGVNDKLRAFAEAYNIDPYMDSVQIAQKLVDFANGSSTMSVNNLGVTQAGTVEADQTVEYQTRYEQAIQEYCKANYELQMAQLADDDPKPSYDEFKVSCRDTSEAKAYAEALATAYNAGLADDGTIGSNGPYGTRGSLGAALGSSVSTLISAYAQAILDYYVVNGILEDLKDFIEELPGAAFVAKIIAAIDCIVPPLFDPPLFDFLNTLEIDFCNNQYGIVLPRFSGIQLPNWKDFFKYLLEYAKEILLYILFRLLLYVLTKIVLMLFDSLCKALQKLGEAASNALADAACNAMSNAGGFLSDVSDEMQKGETTVNRETGMTENVAGSAMCETPPRGFGDMIREAFCGKDATDADVEATTNEVMRAVGGVTEADAARMANSDGVNQLVADISSVLTGDELADLLLGNPNPGAIQMISEVVQTENPDYIPAFNSPGQIRDMMKSIGNMMPMEFRAQLRDELSVPKGERPANPNLCTTPNDIQRFRDLRNMILTSKDGTTLDQANQQFDALRGRALNDLAEAGDLLQGGVENFIANNLPPILGEPDENGCVPPNAIIPREPEELSDLLAASTDALYENVRRGFRRDLTGRKGVLDMILSDTCGIPYSRHERKSSRSLHYSDYDSEILDKILDGDDSDLPVFIENLLEREKGAYPKYVAQWLVDYLRESRHLGAGYQSTTEYDPTQYMTYTGGDEYPTDDRGVPYGTEENPIVIEGEKEPDLILEFRDNNKGVELDYITSTDYQFSEGFNIEYGSYIINEDEDGNPVPNTDNVYKLKILDVTNQLADLPRRARKIKVDEPPDFNMDEEIALEDEVIDLEIYGSLSTEAEELRQQYDLGANTSASPQNNLWSQYMAEKFASLGLNDEQQALFQTSTLFSPENANQTYDKIVNSLMAFMGQNIADNTPAWSFGFDPEDDGDLNTFDKAYMSPDYPEDNRLFLEWAGTTLVDQLHTEDNRYRRNNGKPIWWKIKRYIKENQIMGKSAHDRMFFLSPAEFGGSWMWPPYYIEPPKSEGWLAIREALVPEIDGKEPKRTSVCGFQDIKDRVDELTKKMPDDPRLSECPDCVVELPYSRILDRAAASGMEGPILSIIRIYVLEEMLKAMPVFSNFKAVIPDVMDYTYVEYIIAKMKIDFTENLGRKRGFLKGDALWYTFLEQCVQSYGRRIQLDGLEPTEDIMQAMNALNIVQKDFHYPDEEDLARAKFAAGLNPWADFGVEVDETTPEIIFGREVKLFTKLEHYRRWHLLQAVKDSEQHANVIVRALVEEQLEYMAEKFEEALKKVDLAPEIKDIHQYFVGSSNFVAGNNGFAPDLMSYTGNGDVLNVAENLEDNPFNTYQSEDWAPLPVDVQVTDQGETQAASINLSSRIVTGDFILEKYIRVEDKSELGITDEIPEPILTRSDSTRGVVNINIWKQFLESALLTEHKDKKLSEFFGDLELTYNYDEEGNPTGEPTGIDGSTGVRYGLRLSYVPPEDMANELEQAFEAMAESESWADIEAKASKEKAFFLAPPNLTIENNGMSVNSTILTDDSGDEVTATNASARAQDVYNNVEARLASGTYNGYSPKGARFVIPIAYAEYDALDHTLEQHKDSIDQEMDLKCLVNDLVATPDFELIFRYVFPLNRITSLMSIYVGRAFLASIGEKTMSTTQDKLKDVLSNGYPKPDPESGEWQIYNIRKFVGRGGVSYDRWDDDFLFRRSKRRLVRMFRTYYKSRDFLSGGDDEGDGQSDFTASEKEQKRERKRGDKGSKRYFRRLRRRERDRPFDKNGE